MNISKSAQHWLLLTAILLLGAALRFNNINRMALRGDEAFTMIHWVREPFAQTLAEIATKDPQPPLAYALYRAWGLTVGTHEYTLRFLPALLNTIGTAVLYALGSRIGGKRIGLIAAFLWAINPNQIWHAQDARNYAIWAVASPLALWLGLRALEQSRRVDWILYISAAIIAGYLYYLELFSLGIFALFVVIWYGRRNVRLVRQWFIAAVIIVGVLALWYVQGRLLVGSDYGGTAGNFDLSILLTNFIAELVLGDVRHFGILGAVFLTTSILMALFIILRSKNTQHHALLLTLMLVLPLILLSIVSTRLNVFVPRYILFVTAICLVVLSFICRVRSGRIIFLGVVGLMFISLFTYFVTDYTKSPDWRALTHFLQRNVIPSTQIVQTAADEAYTFYHVQADLPSDPLRLPANPQQTRSEIEYELRHAAETHASLWIVAQTPSEWLNNGVVETWLNENMQRVRETNVNGLRAQEYRRWQVELTELDGENAVFENTAALVGSQIFLPPEPTHNLTIWLYWQPLRQTDSSLKFFVHLVGNPNPSTGNTLWTQDDQEPQDGRSNTTIWAIGEVIRDVYSLPLEGVPPGQYQLVVGMYDPTTNVRLPINGQDTYTLEEITITPPVR